MTRFLTPDDGRGVWLPDALDDAGAQPALAGNAVEGGSGSDDAPAASAGGDGEAGAADATPARGITEGPARTLPGDTGGRVGSTGSGSSLDGVADAIAASIPVRRPRAQSLGPGSALPVCPPWCCATSEEQSDSSTPYDRNYTVGSYIKEHRYKYSDTGYIIIHVKYRIYRYGTVPQPYCTVYTW